MPLDDTTGLTTRAERHLASLHLLDGVFSAVMVFHHVDRTEVEAGGGS